MVNQTAPVKKAGWITVTDRDDVAKITEKYLRTYDIKFSHWEQGMDAYFRANPIEIPEGDYQHGSNPDMINYKRGEMTHEQEQEVAVATDYIKPRSPYSPAEMARVVDKTKLIEGEQVAIDGGVSEYVEGIRLVPWYHMPDFDDIEGSIEPVQWVISFARITTKEFPGMKGAIVGSSGIHNNLGFKFVAGDGMDRMVEYTFDSASEEQAAKIITQYICSINDEACATLMAYSDNQYFVVARAIAHIFFNNPNEEEIKEDVSLCVYASYDLYKASGFESYEWEKSMMKQYPCLEKYISAGRVRITSIPDEPQPEAETNCDFYSDESLDAVLERTFQKAFNVVRDSQGNVKKSFATPETIQSARNYLRKHINQATSQPMTGNATEASTMEAPAHVKKAMEIVQAWNLIQKTAENGVTDPMFVAEPEEFPKIKEAETVETPDANDLVDDEYGEEMAESAVENLDLPKADADMTVDSADAQSDVIIKAMIASNVEVRKSIRRLTSKLLLKADISEENKEDATQALEDDLTDAEKVDEIKESICADDADLSAELDEHKEKLARAISSAHKSMGIFKAELVGAQALPDEEVGAGDKGEDFTASESNDEGMAPSAVEEAGADKTDSTDDLGDNNAEKVDEKPAVENPTPAQPEHDTDPAEFTKNYAYGMSIMDMIAQKRGYSTQRDESAEQASDVRPYNGYKTVTLGEGKDWLLPPMEH